MTREWLTQKEVASLEGLSKVALHYRIKNGVYPSDKLRVTAGHGGHGGQRTEIHVSALSAAGQATFYGTPAPAPELPIPPSTPLRERASTPLRERRSLSGVEATDVETPSLTQAEFWLTAGEAAALMRKSAKSVRRYCQEGKIEKFRLQDDGTYLVHAHALNDKALFAFYESKGLPIPDYLKKRLLVSLDDVSSDDRDTAYYRLDVLERFEAFAGVHSRDQEEAAEEFCRLWNADLQHDLDPLSWSTLLRWKRRYAHEGLRGLVPKKKVSAPRLTMPAEAESFLKSHYLRQGNMGSKQLAAQATLLKGSELGWELPSKETLVRRLNQLTAGEQILYREGRKAFEDKVLPSLLRDYDSITPMEWWVSDHHQFDCAVAMPDGRLIIPWVTAWEDMKSRKLVAYQIVEQPNSDTICMALYHGIKRYGIPRHVLIDNGRDYTCRRLTGGASPFRLLKQEEQGRLRGIYEALQIDAHFALPYNAKAKPIERMFRRFEEQYCSQLPGYRGSHPKDRPENFAEEWKTGTVLSLAEFERHFAQYLEQRYHADAHRGHGMNGRSPNEVFAQEHTVAGYASEEHLRLLLLKVADSRTYQRNGVKIFDAHYRVEPLQHVASVGKSFWVRYDQQDLSKVFLYARSEHQAENDVFMAEARRIERSGFQDAEAFAAHKKEQKAIREQMRQGEQARRKAAGLDKPMPIHARLAMTDADPAPEQETRGGKGKVTRLVQKPVEEKPLTGKRGEIREFVGAGSNPPVLQPPVLQKSLVQQPADEIEDELAAMFKSYMGF